jgi:monovalent cation/proton antiporter MnhG/PhaG subunit
MIDALAAVAVVGGALLAALGGIGLLRFPDVFTRMHAATKAATVGVIGTTTAAAAEVGALSGVVMLLLVIALLFLSGPLGMSLLARAAFHDPETPRSPNTRELNIELPVSESLAVDRTSGTSPSLAVWLFLVWVALFGSFRPNVVLSGIAVAGIVAFALRHLAPRWPHVLLHPLAALRFAGHFVVQLAASTLDVVRLLWVPTPSLEPAVIEVPLRVRTRNQVTLLMNAVSFTPGTVALELHDDRLYVHVLSTKDRATVVAEIHTLQRLIMQAFGDVPQDSVTF